MNSLYLSPLCLTSSMHMPSISTYRELKLLYDFITVIVSQSAGNEFQPVAMFI